MCRTLNLSLLSCIPVLQMLSVTCLLGLLVIPSRELSVHSSLCSSIHIDWIGLGLCMFLCIPFMAKISFPTDV